MFPIPTHLLPEAEIGPAEVLLLNVEQLDSYVENFTGAVSLYEFCKMNRGKIPDRWIYIPARDGAMTIYHFSVALAAIRSGFKDAPSLRDYANHASLKQAQKIFKGHFPYFERMRHAIAHSAELTEDNDAVEANAFTGSFRFEGLSMENVEEAMVSESLINDNFLMTHEGKILSYKLSRETLENLARVSDMAYEAVIGLLSYKKSLNPA